MSDSLKKFQSLLRELFQFDRADLEFGIYRIMNYKKDVIEKFIAEDLPKTITATLKEGTLSEQAHLAEEISAVLEKIQENLGSDAVDGDGNLSATYHDTAIGKRYLQLVARNRGARNTAAIKTSVFNHLFSFFNRYYQEGDFISKQRYSRKQRYAIPYNGEEVYLHWANHDQYYIKTTEHFNHYTFQVPNITVHFRLQAAELEQNDVKGDKKFFLSTTRDIVWNRKKKELTIPFEFRPLDEQGKNSRSALRQDQINDQALEEILGKVSVQEARTALMGEHHQDADGKSISALEHHLRQYTRRNTSDFFIHKDLKGFLSRELDFYLKNEMLNLEEMERAGEDLVEGWFQEARAIKAVGNQIIDLLHQIESFQKMLWEKRKFVTDTQYCVTMRDINANFYPDIAACESQWDEWKELLHIDEKEANLFNPRKGVKQKRILFLKQHPTLVLDTKHFPPKFTDQLLESFDNLDEICDGLLVKSENFQALNFLSSQYDQKINSVYIDPPYNTDMSPILYKNDYKHSTWLTLIKQGIQLASTCMKESGVLCVAIDDEEAYNLKALLDSILGANSYAGTIAVRSNPGGRDINTHLAICHDYCLLYCKSKHKEMLLPREGGVSIYEGQFRRTGGLSTPAERPNSEFAFYYDPTNLNILGVGGVRVSEYPSEYIPSVIHVWDENADKPSSIEPKDFHEKFPIHNSLLPTFKDGSRGVWRWSDREKILSAIQKGSVFIKKNQRGNIAVKIKGETQETYKPKTIWEDKKYSATQHGTNLLKDILGTRGGFSYPKSVHTVQDTIESTTYGSGDAWILDYFSGSGTTGHAVINLNRAGNGKNWRKFILVEMGNHFDTVILPRLKKIIFTPEWKDGLPDREPTQGEIRRSPRLLKYIRLESYEDTLNSIDFDETTTQRALELDEYLLRYMLRWETKHSDTLLNVEKLANPFDYKLRAGNRLQEVVADIPETFNYLLGLNVCTRKSLYDGDRRYLVYRGKTPDGRNTVVIWRNTDGWKKSDLEKDKKFIAKHKLTDDANQVFVNGDSLIREATSLDPLFKARMFAEVAA